MKPVNGPRVLDPKKATEADDISHRLPVKLWLMK
jgi:hypothetical protein